MRFFKNLRKVNTIWLTVWRNVRRLRRLPKLSKPHSKSPKTKWPINNEKKPRSTIWWICLSLTNELNRSSKNVSLPILNWLTKLTYNTWSASNWRKSSTPTTTTTARKMRPKTPSLKSWFWISLSQSAKTQKSLENSNHRLTLLATFSRNDFGWTKPSKWCLDTHHKIVPNSTPRVIFLTFLCKKNKNNIFMFWL